MPGASARSAAVPAVPGTSGAGGASARGASALHPRLGCSADKRPPRRDTPPAPGGFLETRASRRDIYVRNRFLEQAQCFDAALL